jgi:hypothetical protein
MFWPYGISVDVSLSQMKEDVGREISGSHSGEYEDDSLLRYTAV